MMRNLQAYVSVNQVHAVNSSVAAGVGSVRRDILPADAFPEERPGDPSPTTAPHGKRPSSDDGPSRAYRERLSPAPLADGCPMPPCVGDPATAVWAALVIQRATRLGMGA